MIKTAQHRKVAFELLLKALDLLRTSSMRLAHHAYYTKLADEIFAGINEWFREEAETRGIELPENYDLVSFIVGSIRKQAPNIPMQDVEEIRQEVLVTIPDLLERFDPERAKWVTFLRRAIFSRIQDFWKGQKRFEKEKVVIGPGGGGEGEGEEGVVPEEILEDVRPKMDPTEFAELVTGIREYIQERKPRLVEYYDLAVEEHLGQKEITQKVQKSPAYISLIFKEIRKFVLDFARLVNNPDLEAAALKSGSDEEREEFELVSTQVIPMMGSYYLDGLALDDKNAFVAYSEEKDSELVADYIKDMEDGEFDGFVDFFLREQAAQFLE
jgi:DNA-directed RNA polymerase specialized sigma24 family protein